MIINKSTVVALEKEFKKIFAEALAGAADSTFWPKVASKFTTTAGEVDYSWLATIPGMVELKGTAEIANLELVTWIIPNKEFHTTIGVKVKDLERDQLGHYTNLLGMMADAGARHPDELLGGLFLDGFTSKDYTGKNFFDVGKKHFPSGKATFDNKITTVLAKSSYATARRMLRTQKITFPDGRETILNLGRDLTLVCGPTNEATALELLSAERDADGATNVYRNSAKLEVWNYLEDSPAWFLLDTGFPVKPFAFQEEMAVSIAGCTNPEDSHVMLNKEYIYQAYGRHAVGYFLPQLIVGSTGTTAVA